jgi:hypothetical protein
VIDRGKRALRIGNLQSKVPHHAKGLRTRDLVNEVRADKQLRLAVGQRAHRMRVPDFFEECLSHGDKGYEEARV